jgi:CheY-like chemotaxis protein
MREAGPSIEIEVIDTGPGIHEAFLPHVFERFRQADTTTTRAHGGLGLGLALVRHLVELHGGVVKVRSPGEGKGSIFTVVLPKRDATPMFRSPRPTLPSLDPEILSGVKVLVVDDDADARELLATVLVGYGAEVLLAPSASDALETLQRAKPDILLSDLGMPSEDGFSLIRRVRRLGADRGGSIPAAAITAYAESDVGARALSAGFQRHVAKPVDPTALATLVAELAKREARP